MTSNITRPFSFFFLIFNKTSIALLLHNRIIFLPIDIFYNYRSSVVTLAITIPLKILVALLHICNKFAVAWKKVETITELFGNLVSLYFERFKSIPLPFPRLQHANPLITMTVNGTRVIIFQVARNMTWSTYHEASIARELLVKRFCSLPRGSSDFMLPGARVCDATLMY